MGNQEQAGYGMVRKSLCSFLLALSLVGCASWNKPTTVVAAYPNPVPIDRPVLESDSITDGMTIDEVVQAYRISIIKLKDYAKQLETSLNSYRR